MTDRIAALLRIHLIVLSCIVSLASFASPPRLTVFISDLHLGVGQSKLTNEPGNEKWSRLEDFRWSPEFKEFLQFVDKEGRHDATLVILGDALELWQSSFGKCNEVKGDLVCAIDDCKHADPERGCSTQEARRRAELVVREHRDVFQMLGRFAATGKNRVVLVPGNHDAALMLPAVADVVRKAIATSPLKSVEIAMSGYWISHDGLIWGEHGHQFDKVNSFIGWPAPTSSFGDPANLYLQRPWGEGLVQEFYNQYEATFPIVDNLNSELAGIRLAIESGGLSGSAAALQRFAQFLLTRNSGRQFLAFLGDESKGATRARARKWKLADVRKRNGLTAADPTKSEFGPLFVANSIADAGLRKIALAGVATGEFTLAAQELDDEAINALCDARAIRGETQRDLMQCPQEAGGDLGYMKDKILGLGDDNLRRQLLTAVLPLARSAVPGARPQVFVYGHTHSRAHVPNFKVDEDWRVNVFNTGAFQRVADDSQLKAIMEDRCLGPGEALRVLRPEDLPECYSFVRIDYDGAVPLAALKYWSRKDGIWQATDTCALKTKPCPSK